MDFEFIETDVFTRQISDILTDEDYGCLQLELIRRPDAGDLIPGGKGIRKIRWVLPGKGKSGGLRILYYLFLSEQEIHMLYVFKKSEQANFIGKQLSDMAEFVKKYLKN